MRRTTGLLVASGGQLLPGYGLAHVQLLPRFRLGRPLGDHRNLAYAPLPLVARNVHSAQVSSTVVLVRCRKSPITGRPRCVARFLSDAWFDEVTERSGPGD